MRVTLIGDIHQKRAMFNAEYMPPNSIQLGDLGFDYTQWDRNNQRLRNPKPGKRLFIGGNHECLDDQTRAITPNGIKHYYELSEGDLVLSVDDQGNRLWQPITNVIVKEHRGEMVYVSSPVHDMAMTPNHRVVFQRAGTKTWRETLAKDIEEDVQSRNALITKAAKNPNPDYDTPDEMIQLYAWCMTDSHRKPNGAWEFYQSEDKVDRILDILEALEIPYTTSVRTRTDITHITGTKLKNPPKPAATVRIPADNSRELPWGGKGELWEKAWEWSERQVDLFVRELMFCDGSWGSDSHGRAGALYSVTDSVLEPLVTLLTVNGWRTGQYVPEGRDNDRRLNVCKRNKAALTNGARVERRYYEGVVWCVTVPNGRFFAVRGDKPFLTGNCYNILIPEADYLQEINPELWHIPRGYVSGRVMFIGGADSIDAHHRVPGYDWFPEERLSMMEVDCILQYEGRVDVIIAHDLPAFAYPGVGIHNIIGSHCRDLEEIFYKFRPSRWYAGHHHKSVQFSVEGCHFKVLDIGERLTVDLPLDEGFFS